MQPRRSGGEGVSCPKAHPFCPVVPGVGGGMSTLGELPAGGSPRKEGESSVRRHLCPCARMCLALPATLWALLALSSPTGLGKRVRSPGAELGHFCLLLAFPPTDPVASELPLRFVYYS